MSELAVRSSDRDMSRSDFAKRRPEDFRSRVFTESAEDGVKKCPEKLMSPRILPIVLSMDALLFRRCVIYYLPVQRVLDSTYIISWLVP